VEEQGRETDIGKKAAKGFFSILTRNMMARVMGLVSMVVLARALSPSDFGLVSITEVLLSFIAVFGVTGVFEFLVSYRGADRAAMNQSAFWFNILMGLGVVVVLGILAPFWAASNGDARIIPLSYLVSGIFFLSCLQILPKSILSHRLDFATQARVQNPFVILVPIGKIACVYLGFGVYSLLLPTLFFGLIQTMLFYRAVQWRFQWTLFTWRWKEIYAFSRHLIGTTFLTRITDEGDKFILGHFLGLEALGIYNLASQLSQLFTANVSTITNQIFAATFPKYAHDPGLMLQRYLQVTKVIAFFSFPIMACMAVAATPLIQLIYTEKWAAAIVPFQILTIFAIFRSITSSAGAVFNALLVPQRAFYPLLVYAPIHLLVSIWASQHSLVLLASGVVVVKLLYLQYRIYQVSSLLQSSVRNFYGNLVAIMLATGFAILAGASLDFLSIVSPALEVFLIGLAFCLAYWLALQLFGRRDLEVVRDFFTKINGRAGLLFGRFFWLKPIPID
jgi:O-antigen/teichoic acid export membrane protein